MTIDLNPARTRFLDLVQDDQPIVTPVTAQLQVETTPLSAYATLLDPTNEQVSASHSFLLESAEKIASSDPNGAFAPEPARTRHARYSFVGFDPEAVITVGPARMDVEALRPEAPIELITPGSGDTLDALRGAISDIERVGFPETARQQLNGGLVGYIAYDAVYDLWLEDVGLDRPDSRYPDAQFVLNTKTIVFDHAAESISIVFTPIIEPTRDPGTIYDRLRDEAETVYELLAAARPVTPAGFTQTRETSGSKTAYEEAVRQTKQHVLDGDIYQGVISRTRVLEGTIDPVGLYASLRDVNPSPYMYLLQFDDFCVVGASPETLVSVRDREVVSNPIAGTCPRGTSPVEDRRLAGEMLADGKERAEHTMLVDLARNDLRRVCESGSVQVNEFMNVLKYSHVQHIESTVTGHLSPDCDAFDATRATFPAGTLSGAPKIRAMEIIDDLEPSPRGLYGGGIGYYSWTGDADFAIVIRTATIERNDHDVVTVQAGAGIVADSIPEKEYEETEKKMNGVLDALDEINDYSPRETTGSETGPEVTR